MEPIEWIIALGLLFGGSQFFGGSAAAEDIVDSAELVESPPIQIAQKRFLKGVYMESPNGYLISDLAPVTVISFNCQRPNWPGTGSAVTSSECGEIDEKNI